MAGRPGLLALVVPRPAGRAGAAVAGVAGGLQQTAMNVGPTLGIAAATTLAAGLRPGTALAILAAVALTGVRLAGRLRPAVAPG